MYVLIIIICRRFLGSDQHRVFENKRNKSFMSWRNYFSCQVHDFASASLFVLVQFLLAQGLFLQVRD